MTRRSLLFSPGDKPELMRKAPRADPDVVVFDLEDAVAPERKAIAREAVNEVLLELAVDCEVCVRVNPDPIVADDDLAGILADGAMPDSVLLPKAESADAVADLAALLEEHDADIPIIALCESAAGVLHAEAIAASERVDAIAFGAEDLSADIGATRTREGTEVLYAREHIVLAAAAADVTAIDTVFTDIEATDRLREDTEFALELGYDGKMCIHPAQVSVVNEAFTPSDERVAWARRVLDAADEAESDGIGVFRVDGEMIDAPLIAQAELIRARARAAGIW